MHVSFIDSKRGTWIRIESFFTSQMDVFRRSLCASILHSFAKDSINQRGRCALCFFFENGYIFSIVMTFLHLACDTKETVLF